MSGLKVSNYNDNLFNFRLTYNELVKGLSKYDYDNFIHNDNVNIIVKNDDAYDLNALGDSDPIDESKLCVSQWFHETLTNTTGIGVNLDQTEIGEIDKETLLSLVNIPFNLTTTKKIYQEYSSTLRKNNPYIVNVIYQTTDSSGVVKPIGSNNLNIEIQADLGSGFVTLPSDDFDVTATELYLINSVNYTYVQSFIVNNKNTYEGIVPFKMILSTTEDTTDNFIMHSTSMYEGDIMIPGLADSDNFASFIRFDNKIWSMSNNGKDFHPIINSNVVLVGDQGAYSDLQTAMTTEGENKIYMQTSDITTDDIVNIPVGSVLDGNGQTLNLQTNGYVYINAHDDTSISGVKNIILEGGIHSVKVENSTNVYIDNVSSKNITANSSEMIYITSSSNVNGRNITIDNSNFLSDVPFIIISSDNCSFNINSITNFGYVSGSDVEGKGIYVRSSDNCKVFCNELITDVTSGSVTSGTLNIVEVQSSNNANIEVNKFEVIRTENVVVKSIRERGSNYCVFKLWNSYNSSETVDISTVSTNQLMNQEILNYNSHIGENKLRVLLDSSSISDDSSELSNTKIMTANAIQGNITSLSNRLSAVEGAAADNTIFSLTETSETDRQIATIQGIKENALISSAGEIDNGSNILEITGDVSSNWVATDSIVIYDNAKTFVLRTTVSAIDYNITTGGVTTITLSINWEDTTLTDAKVYTATGQQTDIYLGTQINATPTTTQKQGLVIKNLSTGGTVLEVYGEANSLTYQTLTIRGKNDSYLQQLDIKGTVRITDSLTVLNNINCEGYLAVKGNYIQSSYETNPFEFNLIRFDPNQAGKNSLSAGNTETGVNSVLYIEGYDGSYVDLDSLIIKSKNIMSSSNITTGENNIAFGVGSLETLTTADDCIAIGLNALNVSTGSANIAIGRDSLSSNITGNINTAIGYNTLGSITSGDNNVAIGLEAGFGLTGSVSNTLIIDNQDRGINTTTKALIYGIFNSDTDDQYLTINGNLILKPNSSLVADLILSSSTPGTRGQITFSNAYMYVCTATDTWERVLLQSY